MPVQVTCGALVPERRRYEICQQQQHACNAASLSLGAPLRINVLSTETVA